MIKNKKGMSALGWVLTILIILILGVVAWFFLSGNGGSIIGDGSSIPQPPALPTG